MTVLSSAYSASHRAQVAEYRRMGYLCNGWNAVRRWNGRTTSLETAGIVGPSRVADTWTPTPTTGAGDTTVGVHLVRYRYMDSRTGYVSNPSEEREVDVAAGSESLTFAINTSGVANIIRSTDNKVDRILVEMSIVGGVDFFLAAEVLNSASSVNVDIADAELEDQFLLHEDYGHAPPPTAKNILSHRERMWLYGQVVHTTGTANFTNSSAFVGEGSTDPDWSTEALGAASGEATVPWFIQRDGDAAEYEIDYYDSGGNRLVLKTAYAGTTGNNATYKIFSRANAIWVSNAGFPEGFTPLKFLNGPNGERAGDITGGLGYGNSVILYTLSSMFKFAWETDPLTDGFYTPLSSNYGALNQRVVIEVEGRVYAMDRRGWTIWSGVFPTLVSRSVDPLRELIDFDQSENFHCCFFPETRSIRWFVCYSGETYPKHYVQLDVDTGAWSTGEYLQGISDSRLIPTEDGLRVLLGDENGHRWFADQGTSDGAPTTVDHVTVATLGSTTDTLIEVDETLPTTNVGLAGCYLHRRKSDGTGESRLIASNTASVITLGSAFSGVPADGSVLWVGPIPSKLRTRAFHPGLAGTKTRTGYLYLWLHPTSDTRLLQFRVYEDLSATAKAWSGLGNDPPGLRIPGSDTRYPDTDWLIETDVASGVHQIPIGIKWKLHVEFEFEILEPGADVRILLMEHDGRENVQQTPRSV